MELPDDRWYPTPSMARSRSKMPTSAPARSSARQSSWMGGLVLFVALAAATAWLSHSFAALPATSELARLKAAQIHETALMRARAREALERRQTFRPRHVWVEPDQISVAAIIAILTSEDARFFQHGALDFREIHGAIHNAVDDGKTLRGASTLTQQVVKNLYLSEDRSFLRKAKEAYVAWRMEKVVPKGQILRLYLNIAEWGDGIFGIEAAAQQHLGKSAADLTLGEGAALAAMLPNPHRFTPRQPASLRRRAEHVLDRILDDRAATPDEVAAARAELDRWLGPIAPGEREG